MPLTQIRRFLRRKRFMMRWKPAMRQEWTKLRFPEANGEVGTAIRGEIFMKLFARDLLENSCRWNNR